MKTMGLDNGVGNMETCLKLGVTKNVFTRPSHQVLWQKMTDLYEKGIPFHFQNLVSFLTDEELQSGLAFEIANILEEAPIVQDVRFLIGELMAAIAVEEVKTKTDLMKSRLDKNPASDVKSVSEEVERTFDSIKFPDTSTEMRRSESSSEVAQKILDSALSAEAGEVDPKELFISTGFSPLDDAMGMGFRRGGLYIIGARPGVGKSMFALHFGLTAAQVGRHVIYFSLEMTNEELGERAISWLSAIPSERIIRKDFSKGDDRDRFFEAAENLHRLPIKFNDSAMPELDKIKRAINTAMVSNQVDVVVIDYGQQLKGRNKYQSRVAELTEITAEVKKFAIEKNVVVIMCAQLNRKADEDNMRWPKKSELKDCGSLEQDANGVLLIHRPSMKDQNAQDLLILDKIRNGTEKAFKITVKPDIGRFSLGGT